MVLCLEGCGCVKDCCPVLGRKNDIHAQEGVPYSAERYFVLIAIEICRRYVSSNQLTSQDSNEESYHKQEENQVYETVNVAKHLTLKD